MNASRFDAVVKDRAHQRVNERIERFRLHVSEAVKALTDGRVSPQHNHRYWEGDSAKDIFTGLETDKWPAELWEKEEEKVTAELLATMDEMAKALIAPPASADGPQPAIQAGGGPH